MNRDGRGKPVHSMKLGRLLQAVPSARLRDGSAATEIAGLACDSRAVQPGSLFFALPGEKTDGGLFVEEALRRGAVAVVHENGMRPPRELADVAVEGVRRAMAEYGDLTGRHYAPIMTYDCDDAEVGGVDRAKDGVHGSARHHCPDLSSAADGRFHHR